MGPCLVRRPLLQGSLFRTDCLNVHNQVSLCEPVPALFAQLDLCFCAVGEFDPRWFTRFILTLGAGHVAAWATSQFSFADQLHRKQQDSFGKARAETGISGGVR